MRWVISTNICLIFFFILLSPPVAAAVAVRCGITKKQIEILPSCCVGDGGVEAEARRGRDTSRRCHVAGWKNSIPTSWHVAAARLSLVVTGWQTGKCFHYDILWGMLTFILRGRNDVLDWSDAFLQGPVLAFLLGRCSPDINQFRCQQSTDCFSSSSQTQTHSAKLLLYPSIISNRA